MHCIIATQKCTTNVRQIEILFDVASIFGRFKYFQGIQASVLIEFFAGGDKLIGHILYLESVEARSGGLRRTVRGREQSRGDKKKSGELDDMGIGFVELKMKGGKGVRLEGENAVQIGSEIRHKQDMWNRRRDAQAENLSKLVDYALIKVDWSVPQHRCALEQLWYLAYPEIDMPEPTLDINVSPGWKDMGFQR